MKRVQIQIVPVLQAAASYHNQGFDELAMRRKIEKNKKDFSFTQLFACLLQERKHAEAVADSATARAVELDDQLTFMISHCEEYGMRPEMLLEEAKKKMA